MIFEMEKTNDGRGKILKGIICQPHTRKGIFLNIEKLQSEHH